MTHSQRIDPSPNPSDAWAGVAVDAGKGWARGDEARAAM